MKPGFLAYPAAAAVIVIAAMAANATSVGATTQRKTTQRKTTQRTAPVTTKAATASSTQVATTTAATSTSATGATSGCPTANFPDLSKSVGGGASYAKPSIAVSCTATELVVKSNGMISYPYVKKTPNELGSHDYTWKVPLAPKKNAQSTTIINRLGTLGFTVTGIPFYGPTEGAQPAAEAYGDPVANGILDTCGGHAGPNKDYHYHTILYTEAACNFTTSQIVGYAIDGFPVYNAVLCLDAGCSKATLAKSGYTVSGYTKSNIWNYAKFTAGSTAGTSTSDTLDACNGRTEPNGTYAYHLTPTQFPYIIGCLAGTATQQTGNAGAAMPPMGGGGNMPPMGAGGPPPRNGGNPPPPPRA